MCGICGRFSTDGALEASGVDEMADVMTHRGPHASGFFQSTRAALGHRRLSIIDLSPRGNQPLSNETDDVHVVFNGEIYNYQELRQQLSDHTFSSETDTEVLVHLYEDRGLEMLEALRGMFAFALFDERNARLVLARDRFGQKPLYYTHQNGTFTFGSTITSVLEAPAVTTSPNAAALRDYLTYRYVPAPRTAFTNVRALEPGQYLVADDDGIRTDTYWSLSFGSASSASPTQLADQFLEYMREAVRLRLRSDVPVGVFLSGGLDSSLVTALVDEQTAEPVNTYSIGFSVEEYDELEFARLVADEFDTDHQEFTVDPEAASILPEIIDHYEQPFGDASAIPTYYISEIASRDLRVILGGDGGDENFAGYDHLYYDNLVAQFTRLPAPVRAFLRVTASRLPSMGPLSMLKRWVELGELPPAERFANWSGNFNQAAIERVTNSDSPLRDHEDAYWLYREAFKASDGRTVLDDALYVDWVTYLPEDLLVKIDRASMAHSLEIRSPFLDSELVNFTTSIPSMYKIRHWRIKKWLLRRAARGIVPDPVIDREKQGFSVPITEWLRGDLFDLAEEALVADPPKSDWFDVDNVETLLHEHETGDADHSTKLWDLLMLQLWWRRFMDRFK